MSYLGVDDLLVEYFFERFEEGAGLKKAQEWRTLTAIIEARSEMLPQKSRVSMPSLVCTASLPLPMTHMGCHQTPLKKHILVCENVDCAKEGVKKYLRSLRYMIKKKKVYQRIHAGHQDFMHGPMW